MEIKCFGNYIMIKNNKNIWYISNKKFDEIKSYEAINKKALIPYPYICQTEAYK